LIFRSILFFYNLGVIGLDLSEPGPDGMPRMMVGLVKIHHTINANDNTLMFSDAELAFATSDAPAGAEAPALV
jgi:hypothetical protein